MASYTYIHTRLKRRCQHNFKPDNHSLVLCLSRSVTRLFWHKRVGNQSDFMIYCCMRVQSLTKLEFVRATTLCLTLVCLHLFLKYRNNQVILGHQVILCHEGREPTTQRSFVLQANVKHFKF